MLYMLTQDQFLAAVEKSISDRGITPTAFGKAATGDPTFVFELRRGRSCNLKTVERVLGFINSPPAPTQGEAA